MDKAIVKEILLNNIIIKEELLKKVNAALFVLRRDFNELKTREHFEASLEELISIADLQLSTKKHIEALLQELETGGTLCAVDAENLDLTVLEELVGDLVQVENCGERENSLINRVSYLLEAV